MPDLRSLMSSPALTAQPDAALSAVAKEMSAVRAGSVVVVNSDNVPVGILTERDFLRAAGDGSDPTASLVMDWMSPDPVCAAPDRDADDTLHELLERGFRHLPIVEDRRLVGIVSMRDLIAAVAFGRIEHSPNDDA